MRRIPGIARPLRLQGGIDLRRLPDSRTHGGILQAPGAGLGHPLGLRPLHELVVIVLQEALYPVLYERPIPEIILGLSEGRGRVADIGADRRGIDFPAVEGEIFAR